jgi:hypothetical protein
MARNNNIILLMAKLTRYTSFEKLKAAAVPAKAVSTDQRPHQSEFEALLAWLRKNFIQRACSGFFVWGYFTE